MNNGLQIFKNEEFGEVRTLIVNNEPWFVGKIFVFYLVIKIIIGAYLEYQMKIKINLIS